MFLAFLSFIFFILGEAFFSLSEIVFISTNKFFIENLSSKNILAKIVLKFLKNPERLFTTTVLGMLLCIAGNGIFTSYFLISALKTKGFLISSTILPISMIFLGQILPKTLGKKLSFPLVLYLAPFLYFFSILFYPIVFINSKLSYLVLKQKDENPFFISKFRETFLTFITHEDEIDYQEKELMKKIVEFAKKKVSQVMIPASQIKALPMNATVKDALEFALKYNFSYIPLYEGDITNIRLIVKVQDLLGKSFLIEKEKPLKLFGKKPFFIPEMALAHQVLSKLQTKGIEIGIVVDEYGFTTGLITIEDLIEEVLGEFRDALDYYIPEYKQLSQDIFIFKGHTEIEKVQALGLPIPSGEYETIGGFILSLAGKIPSEGEIFQYKNLEIEVKKVSFTKIEEVLIRVKK